MYFAKCDNMMAKSCVTGERVSSTGKAVLRERRVQQCVECEREMEKNRVTCSVKTSTLQFSDREAYRQANDSEKEKFPVGVQITPTVRPSWISRLIRSKKTRFNRSTVF